MGRVRCQRRAAYPGQRGAAGVANDGVQRRIVCVTGNLCASGDRQDPLRPGLALASGRDESALAVLGRGPAGVQVPGRRMVGRPCSAGCRLLAQCDRSCRRPRFVCRRRLGRHAACARRRSLGGYTIRHVPVGVPAPVEIGGGPGFSGCGDIRKIVHRCRYRPGADRRDRDLQCLAGARERQRPMAQPLRACVGVQIGPGRLDGLSRCAQPLHQAAGAAPTGRQRRARHRTGRCARSLRPQRSYGKRPRGLCADCRRCSASRHAAGRRASASRRQQLAISAGGELPDHAMPRPGVLPCVRRRRSAGQQRTVCG